MAALAGSLLAAGTPASPARAQSDIDTYCRVSMAESSCVFTNVGSSPGSVCVRVVLTNPETSESVRSQTVCSGTVEGSTTVTHPVAFMGDTSACIPPSECEMEIETVSYHDEETEALAGWLGSVGLFLISFVIGSTIWVEMDSKRVGVPNRGQWVLLTALVWIIGFPGYLMERSRVLAGNQAAKPSGRAGGSGSASSSPVWVCKGCGAMNDGDTNACSSCDRQR
ncbi:MAG: hypothetical protein ACOC9T_01085 [Myxococcota bacterium]